MGPHADALISYTSPGSGQMSWGHLSGICYTYSQCERESSFISLRVVTPYRQTHWWFAKVQRCSLKHSTSRRTRTLYRTTALNLVHWTELVDPVTRSVEWSRAQFTVRLHRPTSSWLAANTVNWIAFFASWSSHDANTPIGVHVFGIILLVQFS